MEKLMIAIAKEIKTQLIESSSKIKRDLSDISIIFGEENKDQVPEINIKANIKIYQSEPMQYKTTIEWKKEEKRKLESDLIVFDPDQPDFFTGEDE